ncbi:MAG: PilZ domain-containing protein [Alkalispirochaeta sp.]
MDISGIRSTDIVILVGLVGVVVILLISMAVQKQRRASLDARANGKDGGGAWSTGLLPPGIRLTLQQEQLLSRLGWLLKRPGGEGRLLSDRGLYYKVARRALSEGLAGERELLDLARAAGFKPERIDSGAMSTLRLPSGVEVSVADETMKSGAGSIVTNHPDALRVRLTLGHTSFKPGTRLDVVCNSSRGLYRFSSVVTGHSGKILDLGHTDRIESVQRRAHRRHGVELPMEIRTSDGLALSTKTADLSIGGAAARNPKRAFSPGQRVTAAIGANGSTVVVPATVVRTSRGGRVLHLRFEKPTEQARHRLFRTIMSAGRGGRRR